MPIPTPDLQAPASAIFSEGPETLVASSRSILAGRPVRLQRRVEQATQGPVPLPLAWTVSGEVEAAQWLKGAAGRADPRSPAAFQRAERSLMAVGGADPADWILELGSVEKAAAVVLFFATAEAPQTLPSPPGGPDLVGLVKDIVRIQAVADEAGRRKAWLDYLSKAPSSEGKKAALRSLANSRADWPALRPAWLEILRGPGVAPEIRTFAFLLLAHGIAQRHWPRSLSATVALAVDTFAAESDPALAFGYLDGLQLLQRAATDRPGLFPGVASAVVRAVKERPTLAPAGDEQHRSLDEAYQQAREALLAPPSPEAGQEGR